MQQAANRVCSIVTGYPPDNGQSRFPSTRFALPETNQPATERHYR